MIGLLRIKFVFASISYFRYVICCVFFFQFQSIGIFVGPVVQSIISLMSLLMTNLLTVVEGIFKYIDILLQKCE